MPESRDGTADDFVRKWQGVAASELSTSQSFLLDLCRLLDVPAPHATEEQDYLFERPVTFKHGDGSTSSGRIDLYRRGAFVLESKKVRPSTLPKGVDEALLRARSQAEEYARALPPSEGRPPFVIVVDVGSRIELYAEFSRSGGTYTPFPDPRSHRIELADLAKPALRDRLRRIWTDPQSLDPSRESARVTLDIARRLATLARSLEASGHAPEPVAQFLMRCLFTMFAEDVKLLPQDSFRDLLTKHANEPVVATRMLGILWQEMDRGGFSAVLAGNVLQFNGKLFKQAEALPLDKEQLALLIEASKADWQHVEPAIFGTLLERALSPIERHKLGAHFTPRAYVERLVLPTVIEPLRDEWSDVQAAALMLAADGKQNEGVAELRRFHQRLCAVRVLDPACGSGNFLYVTLEHLKRLEGEVLNALDELGWRQGGLALEGERADSTAAETVDPHNLLGIEINPRAAAIAEVVLWIGYLQWHFRTRGDVNPPQPVIKDFRNIECRDAVLAYDRVEYVIGEDGRPVTRWDGRTMKVSPVTGEEIPDETAVVPLERFVNPCKADWPAAEFVVGNPPFIGNKRMRMTLGSGYAEALREAFTDVPESVDLVMYWWHHAADLVAQGKLQRFGLITTNSISQSFNRRVVESALTDPRMPLSIAFAIPNHPWIDATDGAAVRIAMTVATAGRCSGKLSCVESEADSTQNEIQVELSHMAGQIHSDLRIGADLVSAVRLTANRQIANVGIQLSGMGFVVDGSVEAAIANSESGALLKGYVNGRDINQTPRNVRLIDTDKLSLSDLRAKYPTAFQHLLLRVKPERDHNPRASYRDKWWLFAEPRRSLRDAIEGLARYCATCRTSRHRVFLMLPGSTVPDAKVVGIALEDTLYLGVLSSAVHECWSRVAGARHGVGNDLTYNHSDCFEKFPFPAVNGIDAQRIRHLAEQIDEHRKRQQSLHPTLTLTAIYNVLERLRSGGELTARERTTHEQGLVSVLLQLHDELDAEVLKAYGWPDLIALLRAEHGNEVPAQSQTSEEAARIFEESVLERLVALNAERAAEEARGVIRWLRPEFQNRDNRPVPQQSEMETEAAEEAADGPALAPTAKSKPKAWPKDPIDQVRAVADILAASSIALAPDDVAASFTARGAWKKRIQPLLEMLVALGRATEKDGLYRARS